jgi:hypothetical protein
VYGVCNTAISGGCIVRDHRCGPSITDLVEEMMRQVSTKVICGTVVATFLCTACHADGLTQDQVRDLLKENNHVLERAMRENTEALDKTITESNKALIVAISESSATLSRNLTEAIEKLGTHIPGPLPGSPPPIYVHKPVRHVYVHRYVYCCRVIWEEYPCCWPW